MPNLEYALLTRVVQDQDFHSVERAQITPEFFSIPETLEVYRYIQSIYHDPITLGAVPSLELIRTRFPSFQPFHQSDCVSILCQELRREKVRLESLILSQQIQEAASTDPLAVIHLLRTKSADIAALAEVTDDLSLSSYWRQFQERYAKVSAAGGVTGLPYPWEPLNIATSGMNPGNLIYLFGRPKSMKTWVAAQMATHIYTTSRVRVLFYTKEMEPPEIADRVVSCLTKIDYKAMKEGRLQPSVKERVDSILKELLDDEKALAITSGFDQPFFRIVSDKGKGGGAGWLSAKIRELRPHIVFIDGVYLMEDDRGNKNQQDHVRITHISRDLKAMAKEHHIPIVGITQANRGAEKSQGSSLSDLAYADALGQDADAVWYVIKDTFIDEQTKQRRTELTLRATGLRESDIDGIVIRANPATDFSYVRHFIPEDERKQEEGSKQRPVRRQQQFIDPRLPPPRGV